MKNIFTLAAVLIAATSFAQTKEMTFTGTITYEKSLSNDEDSLMPYRSFIVREDMTGVEFETMPTNKKKIQVGAQVAFKLIGGNSMNAQDRQEMFFQLQHAINTQSQTNNLVANMQKARHDAMMATIQNTR